MLPRHALRLAVRASRRSVPATLSVKTSTPISISRHGRSGFPTWTVRLASTSTSSSDLNIPSSSSQTSSSPSSISQDSPSPSFSHPESSHSHETRSPDDPFSTAASEELLQAPSSSPSQPIGRIQRRLSITFTCTVPDCGHRSTHEFSRQAYEKGIVLCQCPKCQTRHLMADHLGWFESDDLTQGGKYRTIEALMAAKGETVARARILADGTLEVENDSESDSDVESASGTEQPK